MKRRLTIFITYTMTGLLPLLIVIPMIMRMRRMLCRIHFCKCINRFTRCKIRSISTVGCVESFIQNALIYFIVTVMKTQWILPSWKLCAVMKKNVAICYQKKKTIMLVNKRYYKRFYYKWMINTGKSLFWHIFVR